MIDSINIQNFQSHEDSTFNFCPGINVISGASSDCGKSSSLRALYWAIENKPDGDAFVSHHILDKKDKQDGTTAITVTKGDKSVTRERSRMKVDGKIVEFNGYRSDSISDFKALRGSVPEQISQFFNMEAVNIAKQLDPHFLINSDTSGGDISRYLNSIVRLDEMDTVISNLEKKRRSLNKDAALVVSQAENAAKELANLTWVDAAMEAMQEVEALQKEVSGKNSALKELKASLFLHKNAEEALDKLQFIKDLAENAKNIQNILESAEEKRKVVNILSNTIADYRLLKFGDINELATAALQLKKVDLADLNKKQETLTNLQRQLQEYRKIKVVDLSSAISMTDKLEKRFKCLQNDSETLVALTTMLTDYKRSTGLQTALNEELEGIKAQMPETCPLCGNTLENCKD